MRGTAWKPLVVTRMRRDVLGLCEELKRTQGDVALVRFGRMRLVLVSHPDDIHHVLVAHDRDFPRLNVPYRAWLRTPRERGGVALGPSGGDDLRLRVRRALQPAYARARVDAAWPELVEITRAATSRWQDGAVVDVIAEMERITVEASTQIVFGGLDAPIEDVLRLTRECLDLRRQATSASYQLADRLRVRPLARAAAAYAELEALLGRHLDTRRRDGGGGDDATAFLLEVAEAEGFTPAQLVREALAQLFVFRDPPASATSWALYRLATDGELRERVRGEAAGGSELPITYALLHETLRLHPPFRVISRRSRLDTVLGGRAVRAGDGVLVCPPLVHRDERWWDEPNRFSVDRWLSDDSSRPRLAFLPFGAGPRKCLGDVVAWREMAAAVAVVTAEWELTPLGPPPDPRAARPRGLQMRVTRR